MEAVLRGAPITQMAMTDAAEAKNGPPFKAYDIRHVNREHNLSGSNELHRVKNRCRFKRSGAKSKRARVSVGSADESGREELNRSPSHESSLSHQSEAAAVAEPNPNVDRESRGSESLENAKPEDEAEPALDSVSGENEEADGGEIELELTLGLEPLSRCTRTRDSQHKRGVSSAAAEVGLCKMELRLDCPAS